MAEDSDIFLRRVPVAATSIAAGGGFYAKVYRHSRSELAAPPIGNHEVVLVLKGCGMARRTLSNGSKQAFRFRPGLLAVTPAGETQQISLSGESLAIHFYVAPSRLLSVIGRKFDLPPVFGAKDDALSSLGRLLSIEMLTGLPSGSLFSEHLAGAVLERLPLGLGQAETSDYRREQLAPWQLRRAKTLIRDNIRKSWSLEELAAEVGTSASHFCRAFRNCEGVPPYRYLIGLRVEHAKKLLTVSSMPLSAVAEEVGCETVGQLSRLFRREAGTSPTAYRREFER
jgi:AraC family transcriptional regulator